MKAATETTEGAIIKDGELKALSEIMKRLNGLDDEAKGRIIGYVVSRYMPNLGAKMVRADRMPDPNDVQGDD